MKRRRPPTGQPDRQPPAFRRLAIVVAEHTSDLEKPRVGCFVVCVILQRFGQARQQARPQLTLLAAQRVLECHRRDAEQRRRFAGN